MSDIHHDPAGKIRRMQQREISVDDVDRPWPRSKPINGTAPLRQQQRQHAVASKSKTTQQVPKPPPVESNWRRPRLIHSIPVPDNSDSHKSPTASPRRPTVRRVETSRTLGTVRTRGADDPPQLGDRDFTVGGISDKRRLLNHREDGTSFVLIDGKEWEVKGYHDAGLDADGNMMCSVDWQPSWQAGHTLLDCQQAIADYEASRIDAITLGSVSDVQISVEPAAPGRNATAASSTQASADASPHNTSHLAHPHQDRPPKLVFKPSANICYRIGFRDLIQWTEGADSRMFKRWPQERDKHPLLFRQNLIDKGLSIDWTREEKKHATFASLCGTEQATPCECCQKGYGPFIKCFVTAGHARGVCTNCAFRRAPKECNFHPDSVKEKWDSVAEDLPSPRTISPDPGSSSEIASSNRRPASRTCRARRQNEDISPSTPPLSSPRPGVGGQLSPELGSFSPPSCPRPFAALVAKAKQARRDSLGRFASSEDDVMMSGALSSPSQLRKRSASNDWVYVKPESRRNRSGSGRRSQSKSLRLSVQRTAAEEIDMKFTYFIENEAPTSWIPPIFRHENCSARHDARCKNIHGLPGPDRTYKGEAKWKTRVFCDKAFKAGEATPEQVRYILNRCPCDFTQSFEDGWKSWSNGREREGSKERYLACEYTPALNQAVALFCPRRQLPRSDIEVITVDSEDEWEAVARS